MKNNPEEEKKKEKYQISEFSLLVMATAGARKLFKIYVGNLPWTVSDLQLHQYFSRFGHVSAARVIFNRDTGISKHFGFVEVTDDKTFKTIINQVGHKLEGKTLVVNGTE